MSSVRLEGEGNKSSRPAKESFSITSHRSGGGPLFEGKGLTLGTEGNKKPSSAAEDRVSSR